MPLDRATLRRFRADALLSNQWRYDTATDLDYTDGNQFPSDLAAKMQEKGLPLIFINICKNVVETCCGILERNQTDCIVHPDQDAQQDVADVLSYKLKQAERETGGDRVCLDAARKMFAGGIGWVEVTRTSDPFAYPYKVNQIPYTEVWTDPRSIQVDYSDTQYRRRLKFFERSALANAYPQAVSLIQQAGQGDMTSAWYEPQLYYRGSYNRDISSVALDMWGGNYDLVPLEQTEYVETLPQYVFRLANGTWMHFDQQNPMHMAAYQNGIINVETRNVARIMQDFHIGDVCVESRPCPAGGNRWTLIPFVFEREARTGVPYGSIRSVRPLQDEINTRRAKAAYALLSTRVIADKDVFDDPNIAREEIGRRDAFILLNEKRRAMSKFTVEDGVGMSDAQTKIMEQTMALAPQISGVPLSLQGVRDGSVESGVGIDRLADYGVNAMSRVFSHFKESRRKVYDNILQYIIEDIGPQLQELTGIDRNGDTKTIQVNVPQQDEAGQMFIDNDLSAMKLKVVLDDVPHSATYRQEQLKYLMQSLSAAPPEVQAVAAPYVAQMLDMPPAVKREFVTALRQQMGLGGDPQQQEAAQASQAAKQADVEAAVEQQHQMELATAAAKAEKDRASALKDRAQAAKALIETQRLRVTPIANPSGG